MNKMRGILIGKGNIGRHHYRLLSQRNDIELLGVIDPQRDDSLTCRQWATLEQFVAEQGWDFDFALVATPIKTHFALACDLLNQEKHVLLEKPISYRNDEARQLQELAQAKDVALLIGHSERFNPAYVVFENLIRTQMLGTLYRIECNRSGPFPQTPLSAGATIDLAVHDLEIIARLMHNADLHQVHAYAESHIATDFEDSITAMFELSGVLVQLTANWLSPRKNRYISVYGYKGMLHCDLFHQTVTFYENLHQRSRPDEYGIGGIEVGAEVNYQVPQWEPLAAEQNEFFNLIYQGKRDEHSLSTAVMAVQYVNRLLDASKNRGQNEPK